MPPPHGTAAEAAAYSGGNSGRDTGSDYGQFDRAVSQAANNPPTSQPSGGDGSYADEEAKALSYAVDVPVEVEKNTFIDDVIENYKKAEIPIKATNLLLSADPLSMAYNAYQLNKAINEKQAAYDAYIASLPTGEDALGGGDYVEDVQEYSERVYDTDYSALDTESQSELDDAYARQYNLEYYNPIRDLTGTQEQEYLTGTLEGETQELINDLVPYASAVIGGSELPPSAYDLHFSNIAEAGQTIMDNYNTAKAKTNNFITTPMTTASYGIFEDAKLRGLI
ncbi:hypothetical protein [uncultured Mediterranean phage uvDeep-CGR2-AD10-C281]|nr:hypothetical protein [uncultured Mediterranean phage uvDeep-CGR2-AD10-C281]